MDFTDACKDQLTRQQKKRVKDHRMDFDLRSGCKNDVPKVLTTQKHPPSQRPPPFHVWLAEGLGLGHCTVRLGSILLNS